MRIYNSSLMHIVLVVNRHREEARSGTATSLEQVDPLYTRAQRAKAKVKTSEIALQKLEDAYKKQVQTTSELGM